MSERKTGFERLLDLLPGFHGYRRKEFLREDDRIVRNYLVNILSEAIRVLEDVEALIIDRDYPTADRLEEVLRDLRKLTDEIRWAESGYSPHYNIVKVREEELKKIIEIDEGLISDVEGLKKFVEDMRNDAFMGNPIREKVAELYNTIYGIRQKWLKRIELIMGYTLRKQGSE